MTHYRTGTIYGEYYNNGKHPVRSGLHNPGVTSKSFRWVGEITVDGKRYRFRSTNFRAVVRWRDMMIEKYPIWDRGVRASPPSGRRAR